MNKQDMYLALATECDRTFNTLSALVREDNPELTLSKCAGGLQAVIDVMVKREILDDCDVYAAKSARINDLDDGFYDFIRPQSENIDTA